MGVVVKNNKGGRLDPGVYDAVISSVESVKGKGDYGDYYRWKFKVKDGVFEDEEVEGTVEVTGTTPDYVSDGSKMDLWLKAAGFELEDGEALDTDEAVGVRVKVTVADKVGKDKTYTNVTDVNKMRKPKKKKPVEEDDDDLEEEAPPPKKKKSSLKKKSKPAPIEDDDDDEEDAPPPRKKQKPDPVEDDEEEDAPPPKKKKPAPVEEDDDDLDDDDLDDDDLDDLTDLEDEDD